MRRYEAWWGLSLAFALLLAASPVAAEDGDRKVPVRVMVTHLSDGDEGIDPKARALLGALEAQRISYPSAKVVREMKVELEPGDVRTVKIGGGRKAHLQLMQADSDGALFAVDVDGGIKVDAKVRRERPLVLDGGKVGDGKRVISIETD